jgi:hypothetical protein
MVQFEHTGFLWALNTAPPEAASKPCQEDESEKRIIQNF